MTTDNIRAEFEKLQAENQRLREALDMAHFYIDAAPFELERKQMTRNDALYKARELYQALNDTKQTTEGK